MFTVYAKRADIGEFLSREGSPCVENIIFRFSLLLFFLVWISFFPPFLLCFCSSSSSSFSCTYCASIFSLLERDEMTVEMRFFLHSNWHLVRVGKLEIKVLQGEVLLELVDFLSCFDIDANKSRFSVYLSSHTSLNLSIFFLGLFLCVYFIPFDASRVFSPALIRTREKIK